MRTFVRSFSLHTAVALAAETGTSLGFDPSFGIGKDAPRGEWNTWALGQGPITKATGFDTNFGLAGKLSL